jgi:hypothetical protein
MTGTQEQLRQTAFGQKFGVHPNSLESTGDAQVQALIREGRRRAKEDLDAMKTWADNGFSAAIQPEDA